MRRGQRQDPSRNRRSPSLVLLLAACLASIRAEAFQLAPGTIVHLNDVPVKPAALCEDVYQDCGER